MCGFVAVKGDLKVRLFGMCRVAALFSLLFHCSLWNNS